MHDIPVQRIIKLCHSLATQPTTISQVNDVWAVVQKGLDVSVGLLTIYVIKLKWDQGKQSNTQASGLLRRMEVKEKEIERLQTEISVWKSHHKRLANSKTSFDR